MPATPTAVQIINQDAVDPTLTAVDKTNGNIFVNNGKTFLYFVVAADAGATVTVTINCTNLCSYGFDHDITEAITVGTDKMIGPFQTARYNDSDGKVTVTYSGAFDTSKCTHAALHLLV